MNENTKAKYSKVPVFDGTFARFPRALTEIAKVSVYGAKKHDNTPGDLTFLTVPKAESLYLNAEGRHMLSEVLEGPINCQDGNMLHKAQKAWNALADLEVYLYQEAVADTPNDWDSGLPATEGPSTKPAASDPEPL